MGGIALRPREHPQDVVCSPMLWLCYANDLAPDLKRYGVDIGMYADDLGITHIELDHGCGSGSQSGSGSNKRRPRGQSHGGTLDCSTYLESIIDGRRCQNPRKTSPRTPRHVAGARHEHRTGS